MSKKTTRRAATGYPQLEVTSRDELRSWLMRNHSTSRGAWIVTFKKTSSRPQVPAADIAEEAICFGWVDSLPRKLDEHRSMLLVTPRKPRSAWSRKNKERAQRLERDGRMTPAGLAVVALAKRNGTWNALDSVEVLTVPADLEARFSRAPATARTSFEQFPRSVKRAILEWIQNARRPETRARRIEDTVEKAARGIRANQWRQKA